MSIDTLYARFISGELSETEIADLKASGEWEELEAIILATDNMALPSYDMDAAFRKLKIKEGIVESKPKAITRRLWLPAAAAAVLLVAGLFLLNPSSSTARVYGIAGDVVLTDLPDGSRVTLNSGSSISWNKRSFENDRRIDLKGEAYFEVSKGSTFRVQLSKGYVDVLGTAFNVKERDNTLQVSCYEGKVRVEYMDIEQTLTKGEGMLYDDTKVWSNVPPASEAPKWLNGIAEFTNANVNHVLYELGRQFNYAIIANDMEGRFTGSFSNDNVEKALKEVCAPMGLQYKINKDKTSIEITK